MSIATPGSLKTLMDQLVAVEETVDSSLRVYRWKPVGAKVQLPAIWNWIAPSSFEHRDTHRWRDTINLIASVAITRVDDDQDMSAIEDYADKFRDVIDNALTPTPPLARTATWAQRKGMRMTSDDFNGIVTLTIEFPLELQLDRQV